MAIRLSDLENWIPGCHKVGHSDPELLSVSSDSRQVEPGSLFAAVRGFKLDGSQFVDRAVQNGATAVLTDDAGVLAGLPPGIGGLLVKDTRLALALAADRIFCHPSGRLKLVGVTGTNGKTTTVSLLAAIFEAAGLPAATMGTLGIAAHGKLIPGDRTTPEAPDIERTLQSLSVDGIRGVAMEVSSHALALNRTAGLSFDAVVFTNLTQDHLDYHQNMESYYQAKKTLFTEYSRYSAPDAKRFTAIVNGDDPYGRRLTGEIECRSIVYGQGSGVDLRAENPEVGASSVAFTARFGDLAFPVKVQLGGHFNIYNTLAAIGAALAMNIEADEIVKGLEAAQPVDGRFESVDCGQPFTVIVDYAHTPDGLVNVLKSARALTHKKLIVVFGCGGDRDPGKRPQMGRIAAELADRIIVTSDNPRTENPGAIIEQILSGIPADFLPVTLAASDRRDAIRIALHEGEPGDVIVIAGKGHETYQIFADRTIHFDDREIVRELLGGAS